MKKNRTIEYALNIYADSMILRDETIYDALNEMDRVRHNYQRPFSRRAAAAFLAVAAAIVLILSVWVFPNFSDNDVIANYSFTALQRVVATEQDLKSNGSAKYLSETSEAFALINCYFFKDRRSGRVMVTATKYAVHNNGSMDEVIIISDLGQGLRDYSELKTSEKNYLVKQYDHYENGEYRSQMFYNDGKNSYYIFVMSSARYAAQQYEYVLIN